MNKNRLEAFSDGVIAILITIMVLELKVPHGNDFKSLLPLIPIFISYIMSFLYLGIYWNNHHHLLHTVKQVSGNILWANLHLLFWLSLIPFVTGWVGENNFAPFPISLYGVNLLMAAIAYYVLQIQILKTHGTDSLLGKAIGSDMKGKMSLVLYFSAIWLSILSQWIALGIYVFVALIWLIPDKRIERLFWEDSRN
ncbi:MAG: DUF1211 domain-containing protein [Bacteroidetes bacterium]|nr:DUF1211 domain-containing protein [Bacteroidota bacterium]